MNENSHYEEPKSSSSYLSLGVITLFAFLLSLIMMSSRDNLMYRFMGFFLVLFSLFKWIDIKGFMRSFKEYDLISRFFPPYLYLYPLAEALLGFSYIAMKLTMICNIVLMVLMSINAVSVIFALIKGKKVHCACLGSVLNLPLKMVSLFEILLMLGMAFYMFKK